MCNSRWGRKKQLYLGRPHFNFNYVIREKESTTLCGIVNGSTWILMLVKYIPPTVQCTWASRVSFHHFCPKVMCLCNIAVSVNFPLEQEFFAIIITNTTTAAVTYYFASIICTPEKGNKRGGENGF